MSSAHTELFSQSHNVTGTGQLSALTTCLCLPRARVGGNVIIDINWAQRGIATRLKATKSILNDLGGKNVIVSEEM